MDSRLLLTLTVLSLPLTWTGEAAETAPPGKTFEVAVAPLFATKCGKCHGLEKQSAGLNLATSAGLQRGAESGAVVVAGKPDESRLFQVLRDGEMPPDGETPLTPSELELVRDWIASGAAVGQSAPAPTVTEQQVVPFLFLRCVPCHGGRRREADLDLRTREAVLRGGKSGPAAIAGKPGESLLVRRIEAEEMPPRRQLVSVSVKPMEANELQRLKNWIAAGLPETPADPLANGPDRLVTAEDRQFWSFRPLPANPPLPTGTEFRESGAADGDAQNPVDRFIAAQLAQRGLRFAPPATRETLIRRVTLDLLGLPPTPDEIDAFVADESPRAYALLVERLLASPRYGERWARHWLDVAGYADSEGAQNEDRVRPTMWRYRDYVIRAFNADKPYDRFLLEQIAGDELADYSQVGEIDEATYDNLVATGFLRTAPDRTFANITNFVPDRLEVIADEVQVLGSAVLGLTLQCGRCHSHKFDPFPQRDYYRLAAALKDALDEHDWIGPEVRQLPFVRTEERREWERHEQGISSRVAELKKKIEGVADAAQKKSLEEELKKFEGERRPEPMIRALWSRGDPSPTYLLQRGNYLTPGERVEPGVPAMLTDGRDSLEVSPPWPGAKTTGRRLALARWLTRPDHPLTARVIVNRVWRHHFGVGIVSTLGNFGKTGAAPSHPELLDWLAADFVRHGWSVKQLHRTLLMSRTYQQGSEPSAAALAKDPENRWLSRMPLRRLEAEPLRDSLLAVADALDERPFGPAVPVEVRGDGLVTASAAGAVGRRSIYILHRRTKLPTILENFDSPQMGPNCVERGESNVAPQALHLLNNRTVYELAGQFAERILREVPGDLADPSVTERRLIRAHRIALGRTPGRDEVLAAASALDGLRQEWSVALQGQPDALAEAGRRAWRNYCHALLNAAEFVYVD